MRIRGGVGGWRRGAATNSISTAQLMGLRAASLTAVSFSSVSVLDLLCSAVRLVPRLVRVTERLGGSLHSQWCCLRDAQLYAMLPLQKVPNYCTTTEKCAKMRISIHLFCLLFVF